jgi:uncharacterized membrane protein
MSKASAQSRTGKRVAPLPVAHGEARYEAVDALRGVAMVWMTAFHFCFDLQHFGYLQANFYNDPFWTWQRVAIVSLFTFCAGVGQAIAVNQGQTPARFWKRWLQIAGCALLVTIGSYFMYPQSFIYFGILHGMAAMLIVVRFFAPSGLWLWIGAAAAIALAQMAAAFHAAWPALEILNTPALNWLGLISRKPVTEDYAPLLPWIGVMLWGLAVGQWVLRTRPQWLQMRIAPATRPLVWLGRRSLSYYMVHQPVLIGLLSLVSLATVLPVK